MCLNRRDLIKTSAAAMAACAIPTVPLAASQAGLAPGVDLPDFVPNRIGISTYSFWRFRDDSKLTIPRCIDLAAEMGFDGVELLRIQMEDDSDGYLQQIKRRAFVNGLDLIGMSTHQGFVSPDAAVRQENVDKTIGFIERSL